MPQENVEVVRRGFDLVNRADLPGLLEMLDPAVELHENVLAPDAAVYHGLAGVQSGSTAPSKHWPTFSSNPSGA